MSYIDTINNSYAGIFLGIPVYHPLDVLKGQTDGEFNATSKNLVVGGGSGEHPGLVIKSLDACAWDFLEFIAICENKDMDSIPFYQTWLDGLDSQTLTDSYSSDKNLEFSAWSMDQTSKFVTNANKKYKEGIAYIKNKEVLEKMSTEEQISIMLGEFIFFSAKHLLSEELQNHLAMNKHFLQDGIELFAPFKAVQVDPEGYPISYGRYLVKNESAEITVKWGLRFTDENKIDKELNTPVSKPKKKF